MFSCQRLSPGYELENVCVEFVSPGEQLNISWRGINTRRMPHLTTGSTLQLEAHYPFLNPLRSVQTQPQKWQ